MSFVSAIFERLERNSSRVAVAQGAGAERREVSARALLDAIQRARATLRAAEVRIGDRVLLLASNRPEWLALDLAVLAEGAVLVPLDPRTALGGDEALAELIRDADPTLVVHDDGLEVPPVALHGRTVPRLPLSAVTEARALTEAPRFLPGDALASLIYTSGSSGAPKGVMLTRDNVAWTLHRTESRLAELTGLPFGAERALHYLPLCYAGSHVLALSCLLRGARLELVADPARLLEALSYAQADYFLNVPLVLERFYRGSVSALEAKGAVPRRLYARASAAFDRKEEGRAGRRDRLALAAAERLLFRPIRARFGARLRGLICGSAPLAADTQRFFHMLGVPVFQGYGLTESTALCTLDLAGQARPGYVGPALPGVEMRLNAEGEIETRGPHVFVGYWGKPSQTRAAFSDDGWLRTGDLGEVDEAGRWKIGGRRSALLVLSSGHNLPPEPLEDALRLALIDSLGSTAGDAQVIVIGHGRPHAAALLASPAGALEQGAVDEALRRFNAGQQPKRRLHRWAILPEALSPENGLLTANLKPRRRRIEERFAELIEWLYARESVLA